MPFCHACKCTPASVLVIRNHSIGFDLTRFESPRAQGAAQAFEDAGVLGGIFSQAIGRDQIPEALRVFEEVRRPRASFVRHRTLEQKAKFALADGPDQQNRDARFLEGEDYALYERLWTYDAAERGRQAWDNLLERGFN